jgi:hypothetical protein
MINREAASLLRSDRFSIGGLGLLLLLTGPLAAQSLSVGELTSLCARAEAAAWVGTDAAFCDWYALPCDCKLADPGQDLDQDPGQAARSAPRWCLPDAEPALEVARARVLAELEQLRAPMRPAEPAVAEILARLYPCPGG